VRFYWKALLEHNLIKRHNNISLVSFGKRLPCTRFVEVDLFNHFFFVSARPTHGCWATTNCPTAAQPIKCSEASVRGSQRWLNKIQINRARKSCSRLLKSGRCAAAAPRPERCVYVFSTQVRGYGIQITSAKSQKASRRACVLRCHQYPLHRKIHRCDY